MEKKYEHRLAEQQAQELWANHSVYTAQNNPGPLYSVDTPPPTVSGALHIGHIFSYTQTDIIARYKRMSGYSVYYPFGFDDNGLPTERFVEKKKNIVAHHMSRSEFIKLCLEETITVEEQFKHLWQRMGLSADWNECYSTIDERSRRISQHSFIDLYKKGFVYRHNEPALFCTACRTSVAQAELDDAEKPSTFNDIVFTAQDGSELIIGTTRPELLPSCVALLYHPHDTRYTHLKNTTATVPLFNFTVPLLEDESVIMDKGTGLVMSCTFGDKTDIAWFKKFKFSYKQSIEHDGRMAPTAGPLAGLKVKAAREKILELLKETNLLRGQRAINHAVNVHERCKNEIEYLMLPQWFMKLLPYKQDLIAAADKINWFPAFMKTRYVNWVENISWDWCISRQRFFGIPFPAWHCTECHYVVLAPQNMLPVDPQETNCPLTHCPECKSTKFTADTDVMDTWNTSSITPYICKDLYARSHTAEEVASYMPMSMRPQAHDIIRTWAFYTIAKSWMHDSIVPWNDIVISGHVLSTEREKLSKSKDNSPLAPENLLTNYSADTIRYWTASGTLGHDTAFSETQLKLGNRLVTKLWNAFLFINEHLKEFTPSHAEKKEYHDAVNEWIIYKAHETYKLYNHYFENYEYSLALDTVEKFFWADVCDNYLELVKNRLFNPHNYPTEVVQATKQALYDVGFRLLQLYAAYLPHITEAIYQSLYRHHEKAISLHQTKFTHVQRIITAHESAKTMEYVITLVSYVRKCKSDLKVSLKTEINCLTIPVANTLILDVLQKEEALIRGVTQAQTISWTTEIQEEAYLYENEKLTITTPRIL